MSQKWFDRFGAEHDAPWPGDCASKEALEAFNKYSEKFIKKTPKYPGHTEKRGIVFCAGGQKLFTNAWVSVNVLRKLGCTLPIEFWCLDNEISRHMEEMVKPLGVTCIQGTQIDYKPRYLSGWELKALALCFTKYKEVLLLDADNVAVQNPEFMFESPQFKKSGAVFWPDYGRLEPFRGAWTLAGLKYNDEPEFESGQVLVDRQKAWKPLFLSLWYNEHSDFVYQHVHGDKETFHLAFKKLKYEYEMPSRGIHSLDGVMCQHDFNGNRLFQHRNMKKWQLFGDNPKVHDFQLEDDCRQYIENLKKVWKGEISCGRWVSPNSLVEKKLTNTRWEYERVGYDKRELTFDSNNQIGIGRAGMEQVWRVYREKRKTYLGIFGDHGFPTCYLERKDEHTWEGEWLDFERMPIILRRR